MKRLLMLIYAMMFSLCMMHAENDDMLRNQLVENMNDSMLLDTGLICYNAGDYENAEFFIEKALRLREKTIGRDLKGAYCYVMIGVVLHAKGDYANADAAISYGTSMCKNFGGEDSPTYAWALRQYGHLLYHMGDVDKAERKYREAMEIYARTGKKNSQLYAYCLLDLGNASWLRKDYEQAEQYYLEAYDLYQILPLDEGNKQLSIANIQRNRGLLQYHGRKYKLAELFFRDALQIYQTIPSDQEYSISTLYCDLGAVYNHLNEYDKAEQCLLRAWQGRHTWNETEPMYLALLNDLGELYSHKNDLPKAFSYYQEIMQRSKSQFTQVATSLSEKQREKYWETKQKYHNETFPSFAYYAYSSMPEVSAFAYDNELFKKGLLLTSTNTIRQAILDSGDQRLIEKLEKIDELKKDTSVQGQDRASSSERNFNNFLAHRKFVHWQWNITWDSVRAVLKPNQVAIEFMRAPLNEDSTMYCALLLRHDSEYPELIPLFEEKQVTRLLHNSTGDSAKINTTYLYGRNGDTLTRLIWGNILPRIHKGEEIYISPTHLLHQIAIEHLPYDETHTMNEVYSIVRLSSTRELVLPEKPISHKKATLYGGIEYRALSDEVMAYNNQLYAKRDLSAPQEESQRQLHGYYAWPLKGTQKEVDAIAPILKSQKIAVTIYSDFSACEESVKGLSGQKQNILHFATHGMYVDTLTTNDPLDRCLLTFAGANRALIGNKVPEGMDDGILTAKEISVLDFREADIVVMSACETGLGDVSGEGVFGLQRAFKMAGAQTILMALWRVDDKATQMLMTAFYRYYSKGISKREAFRKAQQEVRNYTEKKTVERIIPPTQQEIMANQGKIVAPKTEIKTVTVKPYEAPYFWAGFILLD